MCFLIIVVFGCCVSTVTSTADSSYNKCNKDHLKCVEDQIVVFLDRLDRLSTFALADNNFAVIKNNETIRKSSVGKHGPTERFDRFLTDHDIKIKVPSIVANETLFHESRNRKLKKFILPLSILLKLKAAIVIPTVLSIAVASFMGLGVGVMALIIAFVLGFENLLENHRTSKVTYEIVPHLVSSWHWNRMGFESFPSGYQYHTIS